MNKSVFITGASTGIGRACALDLASKGWRVIASVRKDEDATALTKDSNGQVETVLMDVADDASIRAACDAVDKKVQGSLVALINNAGIAVSGPLEYLPADALRRQLDVNVVGQVSVTQALLPALRRAKGRVVFMGSIAGKSVLPLIGAYGASKHALEAITDALRLELRPWGIEVSIVEPGGVATPIWSKGGREANDAYGPVAAKVERHYGKLIAAVVARTAKLAKAGTPVEEVVLAVRHALEARRPKTRYVVGRMARQRAFLARLPDRISDRMLLKSLGVETLEPPKPPATQADGEAVLGEAKSA